MITDDDISRLSSPLARRAAAHGWLKWAILFAGVFSAVLEVIDVSIVNVAMPHMQGNLSATLSEIGWVSTGYAMANVVVIPLTSWLEKRFGKKNYFVFSLIGFTLASVACGIATNLGTLIAGRIVQGLAGGGLLAKGQSLIFETFPPREQAVASAVFGMGVIIGPTIGPYLGGLLTDTLGWRWIFYINMPIGMFATWMIMTFLPEDDPDKLDRNSHVDWWGILFLCVGLGCLQIVLEQGEEDDWFSSDFITRMSIASVIGMALFIWHELRVKLPAVDLRVLKDKSLAAGSLYSTFLGMGLYGTIFVIPLYTQNMLNYTATQTGEILIPGALATAVSMVLLGKFMDRFDPRILVAIGGLQIAFAMYLLSVLSPDTGVRQLFWPLMLRGFAMGFLFLPLTIAALGGLAKKDISAGSSFFSLTRQLGGSIGIAILTTILAKQNVIHRSELVYHVNEFNPSFVERVNGSLATFVAQSGDYVTAQSQALRSIDLAVMKQSLLLSYRDVYLVVGALFIITLPLILLLSKGGKNTDIGAVH